MQTTMSHQLNLTSVKIHCDDKTDVAENGIQQLYIMYLLCAAFCADPVESEDGGQQGVSMSATPVYSELWFILLLALLGLFLLAILLGMVLQRYSN